MIIQFSTKLWHICGGWVAEKCSGQRRGFHLRSY